MEKPHAQAKLLSPTEKCKICNEQAAKHIHYGAMTCFSCRAFFRRSIQNKTAATYACRRSQTCEINLKTRKNCQFCRYQKCIVVGMKPTWVLSEEERERRFRRVRERQQDSRENGIEAGLEEDQNNEYNSFTMNEEMRMEDAVAKQDSQMHLVDHKSPGNSIKVSEHNLDFASAFMKMKDEPDSRSSSSASGYKSANIQIKEEPRSQMVSTIRAAKPVTIEKFNLPNHGIQASVPTTVIVQPAQSQIFTQPGFSLSMDSEEINGKDLLAFHCDSIETSERNDTELTEIRDIVGMIDQSYIPLSMPASDSSPSSTIYSNTGVQLSSTSLHRSMENSPRDQNLIADDFVETCLDNDEYFSSSEDEYESRLYRGPELVFSADEQELLKKLVNGHNEQYMSVNFGEELIKEMIMCSMFGIPVSTTAAITGYRLTVERVTRIANNLESFRNLTKNDQLCLLKENADLLVSLRGCIFFDSNKKGVDQVLISMGSEDMEIIKSLFSQLLKEDNMKHINYKTFNSIQAVGMNPNEDRYNSIQEKVGKLMNDEQSTVLLTIVLLFSMDFCIIEQEERVQAIQDSYLQLLRRYIYSIYPRWEACSRFAQNIEVITLIREMAEIKKSRSVSMAVRLQL